MVYICVVSIILCIVLSAFFSAAEMSFSSNNRVRLEHIKDEGDKRAKAALFITEQYDKALSAILVGNNLVNIASSSLASVLVILTLGESYAWLSTFILTVLVIIFGETVPKISSQKNATGLSLLLAFPVRALMFILTPVTFVIVGMVNLLTSGLKGETENDAEQGIEELHTIIEKAEDEEVLDEDASELVSAAIDFSDIQASEVMTARVDITAIDIDDDIEEIMETVEELIYSRIPVYEESIDHIVGILSMNHFLKAVVEEKEVNIRGLLMEPCYVYKTMKLPQVLSVLKESHQHLAVVTDEYGGTLGVVTLEDVLETLVGEIWDDTDTVEEDVVEHENGIYELDGDMSIHDFIELMGWDEDSFDYESETLGGWTIEMLDAFPSVNDSFEYKNVKFTIMEVEERRIKRVEVRLLNPDNQNEKSEE